MAGDVDTPRSKKLLTESLVMYGAAFALVLALALASTSVGFIAANLYALVAAVFIGLPYWWMGREELDAEPFGLTTKRMGRGVAWGLAAALITLAPFAAGQYVWEVHVQEREVQFSAENWWRWPLALEGEPERWGVEDAGAWVWTRRGELRIGLRAKEDARLKVILEGDRPFVPRKIGDGVLTRAVREDGRKVASIKPATRWEILPTRYFERVQVGVPPVDDEGRAAPRALTVRTARADGERGPAPALAVGPSASAHEGELALDRAVWWLLMWAITQLFFIALPEEYFYRGYLQTRLREAFTARRAEAGLEGPPRAVALITPSNLIASLLFGLGHLLVPVGGALIATRFTVFFPSLLFGWLRERTGTITASVIYHASCNMMVIALAVQYG